MCTFGLSGCGVKPRRLRGRRGFTRRAKLVVGDGKKKREILGPPPFGALTDCETTKTLILAKIGLAQIGLAQNTMAKNGLAKNGFAKNGLSRFGSGIPELDWPTLDWPKLDWPTLVKSGWPKRDWPKSVPSVHSGAAPGDGGSASFAP